MPSTFATRLAVTLAALLLAACSAGGSTGSVGSGGGASPTPLGPLAWKQVDPDPGGGAGPTAVTGWNGGLLGVGFGQTWSSPDGVTWTAGTVALADEWGLSDIIAVDGRAIAAGNVSSTATVWTTTDGATWTASDDPDLAAIGPYSNTEIARLVAGSDGIVAVGTEFGGAGQRPAAWWSADGVDWARSTEPLVGGGLRGLATDGTAWVGVGAAMVPAEQFTKAAFWRSADGRAWTELADDGARMRMEPSAVTWTGSRYVAVGFEGTLDTGGAALRPRAWLSEDGATWTPVEPTADTSTWPFPGATPVTNEGAIWGGTMVDVAVIPGGLLAVGSYWGLDPSIVNTDGVHMAFGYRGVAWTSVDGAAWTLVPEPLFTAPATAGDQSGSIRYSLRRVAVIEGRPVLTGVVPGAGSVVWIGPSAPPEARDD